MKRFLSTFFSIFLILKFKPFSSPKNTKPSSVLPNGLKQKSSSKYQTTSGFWMLRNHNNKHHWIRSQVRKKTTQLQNVQKEIVRKELSLRRKRKNKCYHIFPIPTRKSLWRMNKKEWNLSITIQGFHSKVGIANSASIFKSIVLTGRWL